MVSNFSLGLAVFQAVFLISSMVVYFRDRTRKWPLFLALAGIAIAGFYGLANTITLPARLSLDVFTGRHGAGVRVNVPDFVLLVFSTAITIAVIGLILNSVTRKQGHGPRRSNRAGHGDARFASVKDVQHLMTDHGFVLGEWGYADLAAKLNGEAGLAVSNRDTGKLLRWNGAGNMLVISPPGGGKGTSLVVPQLITHPGSVIVNDPQGENAAISAISRRLLGHQVAVFNPYSIQELGTGSVSFNPLDAIRVGTSFFASDCRAIAAAIIEKSAEPNGATAYFERSAVDVVAGVIALLIDANTRNEWPEAVIRKQEGAISKKIPHFPPTLPGVFDFLNQGAEQLSENMQIIVADDREIGGRVARQAATAWSQISSDERGSHYMMMMGHLGSFGDEAVRECFEKTTVDFAAFYDEKKPLDVFICIPSEMMESHSAVVRVIYTAIIRFIRMNGKPQRDVLLLLDEAGTVGKIDAILSSKATGVVTEGRKQGLRVMAIVQTPAQITASYGRSGYEVWLQSACVSFMNVGRLDKSIADLVSAMAGQFTIEVEAENAGASLNNDRGLFGGGRSKGISYSDQGRALLPVDEVGRLPDDAVLIFLTGEGGCRHPILAKKAKYFMRPEWRKRYARNPFLPRHVHDKNAVSNYVDAAVGSAKI